MIDVGVMPVGNCPFNVSKLVPPAFTVPTFLTVAVRTAPVWPAKMVPVWVIATARSGTLMLVASNTVWLERSPPPVTVASLFTIGEIELSILTVRTIAG